MLILLAKSLVGAYTRRGRLVHGYDNKRTAHAAADDRQGDLFGAEAPAAKPEPRIALPTKPPPEALPAGHTRAHYVTVVREGGTKAQKIGWLAGPFGSAEEASRHVEPARKKASEIDPFSDFDAFGTGSRVAASHPPGVLNDHLGIGKVGGMKQEDLDAALRAHRPDGKLLNDMPRVPGHDSGRREDTSKVWGSLDLTGRTADALRVELEEGFGDDVDPARVALRAALDGTKLNLPMDRETRAAMVAFVNGLSNTADEKYRAGKGTPDDQRDAKGYSELQSRMRKLG